MRSPFSLKLMLLASIVLVITSISSAFAAGINAPASNVGQQSMLVTAEDIKPAACGALQLTNIVSGSGVLIGTDGNDLMIGSAGTDSIDGLSGNDCILGSSGDDSLAGNEGNDICLGGTGNDVFFDCEMEAQ